MDGEEGIGNEFREYLGIGMMSFAREMACSDGRERFPTFHVVHGLKVREN